jgi:predicted RNA-binding Zn-ribbon protein involved in translation (DUF1610 family)
MVDVRELYSKVFDAYEAVPKEAMKRTIDNATNTVTFSCPQCGKDIAWFQENSPFPLRFNEPIFCCGKLMI